MTKIFTPLITISGIASLLITSSAYAATNPPNDLYLGLSGDLTWLQHSDTGGGGNVEIGTRLNDFRIEAEAGYHGVPGDNGYGNTHYFTYMGNLYYDFNTVFPVSSSGWHVAPYIGGGLGDAAISYGNSNFSETFHHHDNTLAYQGMAGLTLTSASMPNTDMTVGYRYLGTNSSNLEASNLEAGLRFHF